MNAIKIFSVFAIALFFISTAGIMVDGNAESLQPVSKNTSPCPVERSFFSQHNSDWASDHIIGEDGKDCGTIEEIGCCVIDAAMIAKYYGVDINPKKLNSWLSDSANKGYNSSGCIYWSKVDEYTNSKTQYMSDLSWTGSNINDNDNWNNLYAQVIQGYPVVVEVDAYLSTAELEPHWVLVTFFNGTDTTDPDNYYINDPDNSGFNSYQTLQKYHDENYDNTFFATRVYHGTKFNVGDYVQTTDNLNVRTDADLDSPEITDPDYENYAPAGTMGKVLNGPSGADGYLWYKIDYGPGLYTGWSAQDYLEEITVSQPDVTTEVRSNVGTTYATLNGNLDNTGGLTCEVWLVWDTGYHDDYQDYAYSTSHQTKTSAGLFSEDISNLNPDTTYHFRAVASNDKGIAYGDDKTFTTLSEGENQPHPVIISPLEITPKKDEYYPGDTLTAKFTIKNEGDASIIFENLTVGGRDPDEEVCDFSMVYDITLQPNEEYNYEGTLTLPKKTGNYHFFCTYYTPDTDWITSIDLGEGLTDEDRIEDIFVKESPSEGQPIIDSVNPDSGIPGTTVTIEGKNFGFKYTDTTGTPVTEPTIFADLHCWVMFGNSLAKIISWEDKKIVVETPPDYGTGINDVKFLAKVTSLGIWGLWGTAVKILEELFIPGVALAPSEDGITEDLVVATSGGSDKTIFTWKVSTSVETSSLHSPGELRIYDSHGRVTGLLDGEEKEEIPHSHYYENAVIIFYVSDSYYYEIVGTNEGKYELEVTSITEEGNNTFNATNIPILPNVTHRYTVDWNDLSKGEEGVIVKIDSNADGIIDNEGILSSEFTYEDFLNIILPDLVLAPGDISISNLEPTEGDKVNIQVTIHNYGGVNVSNARIVLYIDDESIDEKNISLPKHSYTTITFIWIATKGSHDIKLSVDPSDEIKEAREDNNQASTSISVKEKEEKRALESVKGILEKGLDIFQSILKKHTLLVIIAIIIMVIIGIGLIVKRK